MRRLFVLHKEKMPEAEVSLRLAFFLIDKKITASDVEIAIDGAQIKTGNKIHFKILDFLKSQGWEKRTNHNRWQDTYKNFKYEYKIIIHSSPGHGDVVSRLIYGNIFRAECKKGPLKRSKSSPEYPLAREALGQLLTVDKVGDDDILAVAIPSSPKFEELAQKTFNAT